MIRGLVALSLADLATFSLIAVAWGTAGEINPVVATLWHAAPLALVLVKVVTPVFVGLTIRNLQAYVGQRAHIVTAVAVVALGFGVVMNTLSIVVEVAH